MLRHLVLTIAMFFASSLSAQSLKLEWRSWGQAAKADPDKFFSLEKILSHGNGYLLLGTMTHTSSATYELKLVVEAHDSRSKMLWSKTLLSLPTNLRNIDAEVADDGSIVIFYSYASTDKQYKSFIIKLNSKGTLLWEKTLQDIDPAAPITSKIKLTSEGDIILLGYSAFIDTNGSEGPSSCSASKLNQDGQAQWLHTFPQIAGCSLGGITIDNEKSIYLALGSALLKYDSDGNLLWQWDGPSSDIKILNDSIYTTSLQGTVDASGERFWKPQTAALSKLGETLWKKEGIGGNHIQATADGLSIAMPDVTLEKIRLIKLDLSGRVLWNNIYNEASESHVQSFNLTADGGLQVIGDLLLKKGLFGWSEELVTSIVTFDKNGDELQLVKASMGSSALNMSHKDGSVYLGSSNGYVEKYSPGHASGCFWFNSQCRR